MFNTFFSDKSKGMQKRGNEDKPLVLSSRRRTNRGSYKCKETLIPVEKPGVRRLFTKHFTGLRDDMISGYSFEKGLRMYSAVTASYVYMQHQ